MSLEGSLETVALPEVLQLLSATSKTGELLVRGDRGEGRLWFSSGRLTGFSVGRSEQAEDALFDLLRTRDGRFSFEADAAAPADAHTVGEEEVGPVLEVARTRLEEWTDIVNSVPSLDHVVRLAEEEPADGVNLAAGQWRLVVAVGEGRPVHEVLDRVSLPEFEGCRALKGLVDGGLATVSAPPAPRKSRAKKAAPVVEEPAAESVEGLSVDVPADDPQSEELHVSLGTDGSDSSSAEELALAEDADASAVYDHAGVEAQLDPGEFVFSASASVPAAEHPAGDSWNEGVDHSMAEVSGGAETSDDEEFVPRHVPLPEPHDYGDNGSVDHRAALEALLAEIPGDDDDVPVHDAPTHEVALHASAVHGTDTPDGLADRGPWTSRELDEMSQWSSDESHHEAHPAAEHYEEGYAARNTATRFHAYQETGHDGWGDTGAEAHQPADEGSVEEELDEEEPQPEPVNRGLLLKFLSSVRS